MADPSTATDVDIARALHVGSGHRLGHTLRRVAIGAVAVAAVVGLIARCRPHGTPAPQYQTVAVARGDLTMSVTASGTVEPEIAIDVGCEVSGRLSKILVADNDRVARGQVIAEIDPELLAAQEAQASAQLAEASAQLAQARITARETALERERERGLYTKGVVSAQERDTAEAAADRAVAAVALAEASLRRTTAARALARSNLARAVIRSPIDGIVLSHAVEVGQTVVAAFQAPTLFKIAHDLRAMKVSADIDEADVGRVHPGQTATFTVAAYLDRTFEARVTVVKNAARLVDRVVTYEAELAVDNAELLLKPGMTATITIVADRVAGALLVPSQALRFTPPNAPEAHAESRIWILRDGAPAPVAVTALGQNEIQTAIAAPELEAGAAVIVDARKP